MKEVGKERACKDSQVRSTSTQLSGPMLPSLNKRGTIEDKLGLLKLHFLDDFSIPYNCG